MPKRKPKPSEIAHDTAMSILVGIQVLDDVDKFMLAALFDWLRGHWKGDPAELANGGKIVVALERIKRAAEADRARVLIEAADANLRAAVTS